MPSPAQVIVRPAREDDVDAIVSFSAAMAQETEGRTLDRDRLREGTRALLACPERGFFMVAERVEGTSRSLIGQLMVTFEWSDWRNAAFWWVQSVYVDPVWRRQGVYRTMHDYILAKAKADPTVCGIRLYVEQANRVAQVVYRRVGLNPSAYAVFEQDFVLLRHSAPSEDH